MWSGCMCVLTRKRTGSSDTVRIAATNLLGKWRVLIVDQENAVLTGKEPDVSAHALDIADIAGHRVYLHFDTIEILRLGDDEGQRQESH